MAAACGDAAEVPKNGRNPGVLVNTPSAAVRSGFCKVVPPLVPNRKLPGVIGEPSGLKKILRGPSELNTSVGLANPVKGRVPLRALFHAVAAVPTVFKPALWPLVAPAVGMLNLPRTAS